MLILYYLIYHSLSFLLSFIIFHEATRVVSADAVGVSGLGGGGGRIFPVFFFSG